jgi:hypothetical protein
MKWKNRIGKRKQLRLFPEVENPAVSSAATPPPKIQMNQPCPPPIFSQFCCCHPQASSLKGPKSVKNQRDHRDVPQNHHPAVAGGRGRLQAELRPPQAPDQVDAHFRAFSFVDRITSVQNATDICGRYAIPSDVAEFPGALVSEAVGQLAAWAAMSALKFTHRPIAGLAGCIEFLRARTFCPRNSRTANS